PGAREIGAGDQAVVASTDDEDVRVRHNFASTFEMNRGCEAGATRVLSTLCGIKFRGERHITGSAPATKDPSSVALAIQVLVGIRNVRRVDAQLGGFGHVQRQVGAVEKPRRTDTLV